MGFIRIIIWALFFYIIFRLLRTIFKVFSSSPKNTSGKSNMNESKQKKSKIDKKDIIDAEFEEIKDKEKESSQN